VVVGVTVTDGVLVPHPASKMTPRREVRNIAFFMVIMLQNKITYFTKTFF